MIDSALKEPAPGGHKCYNCGYKLESIHNLFPTMKIRIIETSLKQQIDKFLQVKCARSLLKSIC